MSGCKGGRGSTRKIAGEQQCHLSAFIWHHIVVADQKFFPSNSAVLFLIHIVEAQLHKALAIKVNLFKKKSFHVDVYLYERSTWEFVGSYDLLHQTQVLGLVEKTAWTRIPFSKQFHRGVDCLDSKLFFAKQRGRKKKEWAEERT